MPTVLTRSGRKKNDENYELLQQHNRPLKQMRLLNGKQLNDWTAYAGCSGTMTSVYQLRNFYGIANTSVIVPTYRCDKDDKAQSIQQSFPDRKVVGIDSHWYHPGDWEVSIAWSQQEPA